MDRTLYAQIDLALQHAVEAGRFLIPKKTGNLRYNATLFEKTGEIKWEIYVSGNGEIGIAPYAPFTNEPWIADRWHGKPNPNKGWWKRFVDFVIKDVAKTLGAVITVGEK